MWGIHFARHKLQEIRNTTPMDFSRDEGVAEIYAGQHFRHGEPLNEALQKLFNDHIFDTEKETYKSQSIDPSSRRTPMGAKT